MFDEQIESASTKLVQFIQDLTRFIQTLAQNRTSNGTYHDLLQLRCDYARQLASLFHLLVNHILEQYCLQQFKSIIVNVDAVQIWRSIQLSIDQLNALQWQDLSIIMKHIRNVNTYSYNLLCHLKVRSSINMNYICYHRSV
jgi:hypothetical protein